MTYTVPSIMYVFFKIPMWPGSDIIATLARNQIYRINFRIQSFWPYPLSAYKVTLPCIVDYQFTESGPWKGPKRLNSDP